MKLNETSLANAVKVMIDNSIRNIHTAIPAKIESYDFKKQKASIKPLIKKQYMDGTTQELPVIVNVPVIFPRAGGASITFPMTKGDTVLAIFSEKALDRWLSVGGLADPDSYRTHDLSDAIVIPGLFPFNENSYAENDTDLLVSYNDSKIKITQNEIELDNGQANIKISGKQVNINKGNLTID